MKINGKSITKFKRITSIMIPVAVLIITSVLVGVSFAWFSDTSTAKISTLELTTAPVFTLTFSVQNQDSKEYNGETAFDYSGHLVTKRWATGTAPDGLGHVEGVTDYLSYMVNEAYARKTTIKLSTDGKIVDLDMLFDRQEIFERIYKTDAEGNLILENGKPVLVEEKLKYKIPYSYSDESDPSKNIERSIGDIAYGFTWYIRKSGAAPTDEIHTPYGNMTAAQFDNRELCWQSLPARSGVKDFTAAAEEYELWVVFAPEKLFWMQFSSSDWKKTVNEVYSEAERAKLYDTANGNRNVNQPYYSTNIYVGAEFELSARINVTNVREVTP